MKYLLAFLLITSFSGEFAFADNPLEEVIKTEEVKSSKKRRRKKVEMCAECGKPETECQCEGHNDNSSDH